jgi:hypothetical protein
MSLSWCLKSKCVWGVAIGSGEQSETTKSLRRDFVVASSEALNTVRGWTRLSQKLCGLAFALQTNDHPFAARFGESGPQLEDRFPAVRFSLESDRARQSKLQQGSCRCLDCFALAYKSGRSADSSPESRTTKGKANECSCGRSTGGLPPTAGT